MCHLIKVKQGYQITIPVALGEALGIEEGDYVEVALRDGGVFLKPPLRSEPARGAAPTLQAVSGDIHPEKLGEGQLGARLGLSRSEATYRNQEAYRDQGEAPFHSKHLTEAKFLAIPNLINESLSTVEEAFDKLVRDGWLTYEHNKERQRFPLTVYFYLAALQRAHKLKEAEKKLLYYLTGYEWEEGFLDIVRRKGVRGGEPIIPGTRIAVSDIAISYQEDRSDEELINKVQQRISKLSSRQILAAKEYYLAHKREIDEYIWENERDFEPPY